LSLVRFNQIVPGDSAESFIAAAKVVLEIEIDELRRLADRIDESFAGAVRQLRDTLADQRKIVVMGVGKSGNIATKMVATFNSTGAPSVVLDCQNALHGDLGIVVPRDAVLALSYSGETAELLELLPHLRRRAVSLVAMTGRPDSTLARNSDIVLDVHVDSEACPLNLAPTSSTTNMLALGDALAMVLMQARGVQVGDFAELHPAGALGRRLLTRVTDIMRRGEQLAVITPADTVARALDAMTRCRAGAVVITNPAGRLAGIFTHGDFVRAYQTDRGVADAVVSQHMTRTPVTIANDKLAAEAVHVLEQNRIDEIVVVDKEDRVVGLVDVQDLSRARIY
jgi:arabinose-5-phosphate isomerase